MPGTTVTRPNDASTMQVRRSAARSVRTHTMERRTVKQRSFVITGVDVARGPALQPARGPPRSAVEFFSAQQAVLGHFVVVTLAAQVDVRLRREPGRRVECARTDAHLRRSIFVPQEARPTLAAEPALHRGRLRVPRETA